MSFPAIVVLLLAVAPRVSIMEIQGASLVSPFLADSVSTTGIVTRLARDGFYVQDAIGDGDDATSDALFVRSAATVFVGDEVHGDHAACCHARARWRCVARGCVRGARGTLPFRHRCRCVLGESRGDALVCPLAACGARDVCRAGVLGGAGRCRALRAGRTCSAAR